MASDEKTKAAPAPKTGTKATSESASTSETVTPGTAKDTPADAVGKSSGFSRGEGQKVVTQAYKDNWNAIFGKKTKQKSTAASKTKAKKKRPSKK
jgi:hypothetical protein